MCKRVIIVTGATDVLGYEVVKQLSESPVHDVIMACSDEVGARRAMKKILEATPSAMLTYIHLDLSRMASVRKFVDEFQTSGKFLNVLINCASIGHLGDTATEPTLTEDMFEITMATNHLGHFLLTNLLLEELKASGLRDNDARVVVVTSDLHDVELLYDYLGCVDQLDLGDLYLQQDVSYTALQAYKNSKLANVLFTKHLHTLLRWTGVTVNCVCPGFVRDEELSDSPSVKPACIFFTRQILDSVLCRFDGAVHNAHEAANYICSLAVDHDWAGVSGSYVRGNVVTSASDEALDEELQRKLWTLSASYTHLDDVDVKDEEVAEDYIVAEADSTSAAARICVKLEEEVVGADSTTCDEELLHDGQRRLF